MKKEIALNILEEIQQSLSGENPKENTFKILNLYKKNLEISTSEKIQTFIKRHKQYIRKYGEDNKKTSNLAKKIDKEINKIYNK